MKHIITLLTIVLASATISSCTKKYDEYGLNCKVKSVLEQSYSMTMKFGEPAKEYRVQNELMEFNKNGQMVSKNIYYDSSDELELREKEIYKYNDKGLLIEKDEYWENGNLWGKEVYEYDDYNHVTDEYDYDSDGNIRTHYHYEYDKNDNNILMAHYDKDGSETWRVEMTYDNNHHETERVCYENGSEYFHNETTWDGDKISYSVYYYNNGTVHKSDGSDFFYTSKNENGLYINMIHNEWGNVTYEYVTFDKKGNWTKRYAHDSKTNEIKYITERVITY